MARPLRWLAERGFGGRRVAGQPEVRRAGRAPLLPVARRRCRARSTSCSRWSRPTRAEDAVRSAGAAGAAAVVVFASGFAEVGDDGAALQRRLVAAARESGVRVLGPNCQGVLLRAVAACSRRSPRRRERPLDGGSRHRLRRAERRDRRVRARPGRRAGPGAHRLGQHRQPGRRRPHRGRPPPGARPGDLGPGRLRGVGRRRRRLRPRSPREAAEAGTALVVLRSGRSDAGGAPSSRTPARCSATTRRSALVSQRHGVVLVDDVEELLAAATVLRSQAPPGRSAGRRP